MTFENFTYKWSRLIEDGLNPNKTAFLFGLINTSMYLIKGRENLTATLSKMSHSLFSENDVRLLLPSLLKTWSGEDDNGQSEMDYKEEGKPSLMYMLERAKEMGRPDYCLFFILGLIRGRANSKWIDESEVKEILGAFPSPFMEENQELARHWFEYFDEVGVYLKI